MSASRNATRVCFCYQVPNVSLVVFHKITNRATPNRVGVYTIALQIFKTFNLILPDMEWMHSNRNQIHTLTQTQLHVLRNNNYKVGISCLINKFPTLNDKIPSNGLTSLCFLSKLSVKNFYRRGKCSICITIFHSMHMKSLE
jgi:hypothetical protein